MKLYFSGASPYVRKVQVTAIETGLDAKIEHAPITVGPTKPDPSYGAENPLYKVPTLVTDGGEVLYDSPVICDYLDSLHDGAKLIPPSGGARWRALRLEALADGMTEAGLLIRYELLLRPEDKRSADWMAGQAAKVNTGLDSLERDIEQLSGPLTIGQIAVGCCIGWLDFRKPVGDPLDKRPNLASWYRQFLKRPSMAATMPQG
jgi:glutathione S-transferase